MANDSKAMANDSKSTAAIKKRDAPRGVYDVYRVAAGQRDILNATETNEILPEDKTHLTRNKSRLKGHEMRYTAQLNA